jgi:exopolysaccharide biosynthesis predicted pyruvyltransferase EpsI
MSKAIPVPHVAGTLEFLRQFRNRRVLYFPNPGNAGDSLIAAATILSLRQLNVSFQPISLDAPVDDEIVLLGGGGNLVPAYDSIALAFERFLGRARQLILLPHTIRGSEELLGKLDASCVLFCRDPESYLHVLQAAPGAHAMLAHDMAFHLDPQELLSSPSATQFQEFFVSRLRSAGIDWEQAQFRIRARYFRRDGEATGRHPGTDIDISEVFSKGVWPENALCAAWAFLEAIRTVDAIETDRLHVAIGAGLLGTPCTLHDNSYGKNWAVYRHSLRHYFDCVTFSHGD